MSDTPRTDAACLTEYRAWNHPNNGTSRVAVLATLARTLERELAEALDVAERAVKMAQEQMLAERELVEALTANICANERLLECVKGEHDDSASEVTEAVNAALDLGRAALARRAD